jgi:hypothetical protein
MRRRISISSCLVCLLFVLPFNSQSQPAPSSATPNLYILELFALSDPRWAVPDRIGKVAEGKQYQKAQGKYSLEGALLLKTHAAQQKLKEKEKGVHSQAG